MQHAEEVVDVTFPAGHETPEVVEPSEEALDLPAPSRAPQASTVLGEVAPSTPMRGDHFDAIGCHQEFVERVAVVAAVADQSRREVREEAGVKGRGDEVRLIR